MFGLPKLLIKLAVPVGLIILAVWKFDLIPKTQSQPDNQNLLSGN